MKKRLPKILIPLLIIISAAFLTDGFGLFKNTTVLAVGDLVITWGVPSGDPIFVVSNLLPGDTEEREVNVENNASVARPIAIKGVKTSETGNLPDVLEIIISEGATVLYGPKSLSEFFTESATDGIPLSTINPGGNSDYKITVSFPDSAGNEFQFKQVIFNLIIGVAAETHEECEGQKFSGPAIFGTSGNDNISGTTGNDLIFALEGNDRVTAFGGDDCIIGGEGNDELRGETGNDRIFGGEGDDLIIGAVGEDRLFGGEGNDNIRGENGEDYIEGGEGNDTITGGNGNDEISGNGGNDNIDGQNGNDNLSGDDGTDNLNGSAGTDTCSGEVEVNCEL